MVILSPRDDDQQPVEYLSGTRLAELLGVPEDTPLSAAVGVDAAVHIMDWIRTTLFWGHDFPDAFSAGTSRENPWLGEIPAIPVAMVVGVLAAAGVAVPTRRQAREWLAAQQDPSEYDPELEVRAAELTVDPDLFDVAASAGEARICGVPRSVFDQLTDPEKAKVVAGHVIAPPQAPTPVARRLARRVFAVRRRPPGARRRAWMTTLLRADQTWYEYAEHTAVLEGTARPRVDAAPAARRAGRLLVRQQPH
jgi:hypothetical protein